MINGDPGRARAAVVGVGHMGHYHALAYAEMLESGEIGALARAAGVTYRPPRQPNVSPDLKLTDIRRN
jgi:hypothetical protein